jgi:hypothetical protein
LKIVLCDGLLLNGQIHWLIDYLFPPNRWVQSNNKRVRTYSNLQFYRHRV